MILGTITVNTCYGRATLPVEVLGKGPRLDPAWIERGGPGNAATYLTAVSRVDRSDYGAYGSRGWPLFTWRSLAVETALSGKNPLEALGEAQRKANAFQKCYQSVNAGVLQGSALNEQVNACARQADPDLPWGERVTIRELNLSISANEYLLPGIENDH